NHVRHLATWKGSSNLKPEEACSEGKLGGSRCEPWSRKVKCGGRSTQRHDTFQTSALKGIVLHERLNICPPYHVIRHTLYGPRSMVKWTKHNAKRYHQSLPCAHMLEKARV
ncbi:hypothetical protein H5410_030957, partial [Solanum commersonii]